MHSRNIFVATFLVAQLTQLFFAALTHADEGVSPPPPPIPFHSISLLRYLSGQKGDRLSLPSDVAVNEHGVYVVDGGNHRIVVFDQEGDYRFQFAAKGSKAGQLSGPVGLGLDAKGRVYVADRGNARIQIFDSEGTYLSGFTLKSKGKVVVPIDIAANPRGSRLYITGNNNHRLMVVNHNGKLLRQWGGNGLNRGQFRYPGSVLVKKNGHIAVVDILNTRVQVFNRKGEFSRQIGDWGVLPGQFVRPKGVATDSKGWFYVSDSYMGLIQVFDDEGQFRYVLKEDGGDQGMVTPAGIAIDKNDRLYVTEMLKNRVAVYNLRQ